MTDVPLISIVIPTTASPSRAKSLRRAVESVATQSVADVGILAIVNGSSFDPDSVAWLKSAPGVEYHYIERGYLPGAILEGRRRVRSPFFGFLDDDDYLLPGALATRLDRIRSDDGYDVAVSTGFREQAGVRSEIRQDTDLCRADPLAALAQRNWLASCGALFRTETVGDRYFDDLQKYAEWTDVAFRLSLDRRIDFDSGRTFVIEFNDDSLSNHTEFMLTPATLIRAFLGCALPTSARRAFARKYMEELHNASDFCRREGRTAEAWRYHLRCLAAAGGLRYLGYTRYLLAGRGDGRQ